MKQYKDIEVLMPSTYEVKIDLIGDLNRILNKKLERMGYKSDEGVFRTIDYFKALKKLIPMKPRNILYSDIFECPTECREGLNLLVKYIQQGKNLVPFMSKKVINPTYNDLLLNDWGIYHFHLNTEKDNRGFIKRSKWLLLAYFDDSNAYFINVYHHNKQYLWSHQRMVGILYNNWPHLIKKFHIEGFSELSEKLDDAAYAQIRKSKGLTFIELGKDKIFGLIGGGYASDGSSLEAVRESDYWHNYLSGIEFFIKENYYSFKVQLTNFDKQSINKSLWIRMLGINDDELILLENNRLVLIKCNYLTGQIRMCRLEDLIYEYINDRTYYRRNL